MTPAQHRAALEAQLMRDGGKLRPMPEGPRLEKFDPILLAQAIEYELNRQGEPKLRLDFDREDAMEFASFLRRAAILGA